MQDMTDQNPSPRLGHACQNNEVLLATSEHYLEIGERRERNEVTEDGDIDTFDRVAFLIGTRREVLELVRRAQPPRSAGHEPAVR
jgi:hypothetical protein